MTYEYETLKAAFDKDPQSVLFRKNDREKWTTVSKIDQLFSIHGFEYKIKSTKDNLIDKEALIKFIQGEKVFVPTGEDEDCYLAEGFNNGLDAILEYLEKL